jgi:hypothetical protein
MQTPGTPEVEAAGRGTASGRRRLRLIASVLLLLLLIFAADVVRIALNGSDLAEPLVTSASTVSIAAEGDAFFVTSAVTAMPACSAPATLAPGVDRCLVYSLHNPGPLPIVVTSISVASVDAPASCPAEHLDVGRTTFTGELTVPAGGTVSAPGVPLALHPEAAYHDGCRSAAFSLRFSASARYAAATP